MFLNSILEFRGYSERKDTKNNIFKFINVEDDTGESSKLLFSNNDFDIATLKKGEKYNFIFDFNSKFGSLKIVNIKGVK